MLRKLLIVAGALSVVSISAQADERQILNGPTTIGSVTGVVTEYATLDDMYGGAINNPSGYNLTISANSSISDNKLIQTDPKIGVYGGAIAQQDGNLSIGSNVTFSNNIVTGGSQIYENWDGTDSASGGAIYINGNYTVTTSATGKVIFTDNHAYAAGEGGESNGGAIFAGGSPNGASITFHNVEFSNNSSVTRGGAIYNGETDIKIEGQGTFSGNTSKTGGAVYNYDTTGYTKFSSGTNTTFTENKATGNGGAIANFDGVVNIGKGNSFSGNEAEGKGGAIYNANFAKTSVTNISGGTTFTENKAGTSGGAIHTSGTTKIDTTDGNVLFYNNEAPLGADLYLDGTSSELRVTGNNANYKVSFGSKNSIAGEGNIIHESKGTFELKDNSDFSDFTGNYTQTSGKTLLNNSTIFDKFDIKGGELELINGSVATIDNDGKNFSGSAITITSSTLDLTTSIADAVKVNVNTGGILNLSNNSTLTITKGNDNWTGTINVGSNGRATDDSALIVNGYNGVVTYTQKSGSLTLQNSADITLNDADSSISAGDVNVNGNSTLTIKDGATINGSANTTAQSGSTVNVNKGILGDSNSTGKIDLQQGSTLNITNNGSVTIHSNDNLGANINLGTAGSTTDNSTLVLDKYNGSINYKQNSGSLTLQNSADVTLKDENSSISAGNVNVNGNSTLTIKDGATINGSANTTAQSGSTVNVNNGTLGDSNSTGKIDLQQGSTLNITNNGNVTLNSKDNWAGTINLGTEGDTDDSSTLTVNFDEANTGELHAETGNLIITNQNFTVGENSYIYKEVNIQTSGTININGGFVAIDDLDSLEEGATLTLDDGTLEYYKNGANAFVSAIKGKLDLMDGSSLTISGNTENSSSIASDVELTINKEARLTLENTVLNLDEKDAWLGHITNESGTINANGVRNASGSLGQADGELNLDNSNIILNSESSITGGDIRIENNSTLTIVDAELINTNKTNMTIDADSTFNVSSSNSEFSLNELNASAITNPDGSIKQASLINVMNDQLNRATINNLGINTQANFNVDILGRSSLRNDSDKFTIGKLTDSGTIKIDDWKFYGDVYGYDAPVDRHVKLGDIFILDNDENGKPIEASIETTDKTNFSPIGWYQLNKGAGARGYTLDLVKYNPQVFRGQVATVSQWMNQLAIEDMLFTHSMVLPSFKEEDGGKMANNYASADALFAPYQYSRKDGGLWVKTYGTFEHLQMSNGLKHVGNNSYGTLIGADLGLKDLKNGWKFMPTAYVGYNGAHQYWSNVSQYQNGGQAGFLGTWYKDNFILGAMAYGGLYGNTMDVYGHTDETFNYFAGTAAKASYNVRVHRDFVIQPNLLASYNYFGQQNWHSNFGQMGMMSGMLHGVNIAPGVNFIWERDTFSAYLTLQYMYNVNGASGGRAGNVDLPNLVMQRGYIQYGIGFTKKFTDRASGYFQAVLRNAGRTGVGLQAGFLYRIGK